MRDGHALCLMILVAVTGCRASEDVLARVGSEQVRAESFHGYLEAVTGEPWKAVEQRVASRLLDQFLDQEVVVAAAYEQHGLSAPSEPGRRSAVVRTMVEEVCGPPPPPPAEQIEAEVQKRIEEPRPAQAHVRQMLLYSKEDALAARQRLADGESFVEVSIDVSMAPNAAGGGELGMVKQGTLPVEMDDVIFAMAAGEVSDPIASPAGYHIFEVLEAVPEGTPAHDLVESQVKRELGEEILRRFTQDCVERLADEVGVRVYPSHIWFQYTGKYHPR
jgi:parvulin-like peptidyl-prolyl isomerase